VFPSFFFKKIPQASGIECLMSTNLHEKYYPRNCCALRGQPTGKYFIAASVLREFALQRTGLVPKLNNSMHLPTYWVILFQLDLCRIW